MSKHRFAICVRNSGHEVSLERRKRYEIVDDANAAAHRQLRVIDESGEDYLSPETFFLAVQLPEQVAEQAAQAA